MFRFPILVLCLACCAPAHPQRVEPTFNAERFRAQVYTYRNTVDVGDVDDLPMLMALERARDLAKKGEKEITLRIDSFGGGIFLGNRWIREMEDLKKAHGLQVACIVDGAAYSMGAVILESPLCDQRLATKRSTILFHNGSAGGRGTAEDLKEAAAFLEALNVSMALVIADRLEVSLEEYRARVAHADWMMAVPEALASNVIDGFASPSDIEPPAEG